MLPLHVPIRVFAVMLDAMFINNMHFGIGFSEVDKIRRPVDAAAAIGNVFLISKPIVLWIARADYESKSVIPPKDLVAHAQKFS